MLHTWHIINTYNYRNFYFLYAPRFILEKIVSDLMGFMNESGVTERSSLKCIMFTILLLKLVFRSIINSKRLTLINKNSLLQPVIPQQMFV